MSVYYPNKHLLSRLASKLLHPSTSKKVMSGSPAQGNDQKDPSKGHEHSEKCDFMVSCTLNNNPVSSTADLCNTTRYSLKRVLLKKEDVKEKQLLGFKTDRLAAGVLKVVKVDKSSVAQRLGIEVGMFLLAVNGRHAQGTVDELKPDQGKLRLAFASPLPPSNGQEPQVPLPYVRVPGCIYTAARLPPGDGKMWMLELEAKKDRVCVKRGTDGKLLSDAGLHLDDGILAVDGVAVRDLNQCRQLLQDAQGDPVDLIIERPPLAPPLYQPADDEPDDVELELTGMDKQQSFSKRPVKKGDPASGVPVDYPKDVKRIVKMHAKHVIEEMFKPKQGSRAKESTSKPSQKPEQHQEPHPRVKMDKKVESEKLEKTP